MLMEAPNIPTDGVLITFYNPQPSREAPVGVDLHRQRRCRSPSRHASMRSWPEINVWYSMV